MISRGFVRILLLLPAAVCLGRAQDTAELLKRMQAMEERIKTLEAEVQTLKGQPAAPVAPANPPAAMPPAAPTAIPPEPSLRRIM